MGKTLFLLDNVQSARMLLASGELQGEFEILSLHYSVVGFLGVRGIPCSDFSDWIDAEMGRAAFQSASHQLDEILTRLDRILGYHVCRAAGLPDMDIFYPLFKYPWTYRLAGISIFDHILHERLKRGDIAMVHYFYSDAYGNHPVFSLLNTAKNICSSYDIKFIGALGQSRLSSQLTMGYLRLLRLTLRVMSNPVSVMRRVLGLLREFPLAQTAIQNNGQAAIVFGANNFFFPPLLQRGMQILVFPRKGIRKVKGVSLPGARSVIPRVRDTTIQWLEQQSLDSTDHTAYQIVSHFIENAEALLFPVIYLSHIMHSYKIRVAAWDVPLILEPSTNLVLEYLLNAGLTVLGRQHGSSYVDQILLLHFDSDFNRCTHWFSYGLGKDEFEKTYPGTRPKCQFIPAGGAGIITPPKWAKVIDIAFPITICCHLAGIIQLESQVAHRQQAVLTALETRKDVFSVVKPMIGYDENNFSQCEALRRLKHVKVVGHMTWREFLRSYRPRLVVIENISTPLYDAIGLDVDIFLMLDDMWPLSTSALTMLKKRVHIFETPEDLAKAILLYGTTPLNRLRDKEFYQTFVNRGLLDAALDMVGL